VNVVVKDGKVAPLPALQGRKQPPLKTSLQERELHAALNFWREVEVVVYWNSSFLFGQ
jgi:hypothetical protein